VLVEAHYRDINIRRKCFLFKKRIFLLIAYDLSISIISFTKALDLDHLINSNMQGLSNFGNAITLSF
jgi:uncharacterized membrane protein (DUF485 family)